VPDADDTAGALLALHNLGDIDDRVRRSAESGVDWLLGLQNRDGGIPTFCRGWGKLPFDRSSPDLTAHALQAWSVWLNQVSEPRRAAVRSAIARGVRYLAHTQAKDGSWAPLWFGNERAPDEENRTYGTARVVSGLQPLARKRPADFTEMLARAGRRLIASQNGDGGWSGFPGGQPSVEETGLAVEALASLSEMTSTTSTSDFAVFRKAASAGAIWLMERVQSGDWRTPSPIGFYFARLWYYERLYPLIFTAAALGRVASMAKPRSGFAAEPAAGSKR
jgi:squalene-hopene/tetraprenyl-beta-curcumene cyclase